jgi:hypothetical protein
MHAILKTIQTGNHHGGNTPHFSHGHFHMNVTTPLTRVQNSLEK